MIPLKKNRWPIVYAKGWRTMKEKITPENIKRLWDDAIHLHERYELERSILRLTHWVDQQPDEMAFVNDVKTVLATASHVLHTNMT